MFADKLLSNRSITLERGKTVITITQKTVRFDAELNQLCNISRFGEGAVEMRKIPDFLLLLGWIIGLLLIIQGYFPMIIGIGYIIFISAMLGFYWNVKRPKYHGLLLTLNSGHEKLFITSDKPGLRLVISTIYEFIEYEELNVYKITVNTNSIQWRFYR